MSGGEIKKLASNTNEKNVAFAKSPCFAPAGNSDDNDHPEQRITDDLDLEWVVGVFILLF
jgi:hypothetical protein